MEEVVALLQSVELHLSVAKEELKRADALRAPEIIDESRRLVESLNEIEAALYERKKKLLHSLQKAVTEIRDERGRKRKIEILVKGYSVRVGWLQFRVGFRSRAERDIYYVEDFPSWLTERGIFYEFCRECLAEIEGHLKKTVVGDAFGQEFVKLRQFCEEVRSLESVAKPQ